MKKIVIILIILISNLTSAQNGKSEEQTKLDFRKLTGKLTDKFGKPVPAQSVMIKGTKIGTQTNLDGFFCLLVPRELTIYIEIPLLNYDTFREIKPETQTIDLKLGKGKWKSKKAWRNYVNIKADLNTRLERIYNSYEYESAENICG